MLAIRIFLGFIKDKQVQQITNEDVVQFNNPYIIKRGGGIKAVVQQKFIPI